MTGRSFLPASPTKTTDLLLWAQRLTGFLSVKENANLQEVNAASVLLRHRITGDGARPNPPGLLLWGAESKSLEVSDGAEWRPVASSAYGMLGVDGGSSSLTIGAGGSKITVLTSTVVTGVLQLIDVDDFSFNETGTYLVTYNCSGAHSPVVTQGQFTSTLFNNVSGAIVNAGGFHSHMDGAFNTSLQAIVTIAEGDVDDAYSFTATKVSGSDITNLSIGNSTLTATKIG